MAESGCFQDPPISAGNRPDKNRLVLRGKKEMCQSILSIHPETQMPDRPQTPDERLQLEFNRWAAEGEGEKMERHHLDITEKTIRLMNLRPGERVLDLGCGSGWATRLLARLVGEGPEGFGQVVGLDVSDEMVRQAREASRDFENILYV